MDKLWQIKMKRKNESPRRIIGKNYKKNWNGIQKFDCHEEKIKINNKGENYVERNSLEISFLINRIQTDTSKPCYQKHVSKI